MNRRRKYKVLRTVDGEKLDGFQEIKGFVLNARHAPVKPAWRCKRCGCWLRASQATGSSRKGSPTKRRIYCSTCEEFLDRLLQSVDEYLAEKTDAAFDHPKGAEATQSEKLVCRKCGKKYASYICANCGEKQDHPDLCFDCHRQEPHVTKLVFPAGYKFKCKCKCRICGAPFSHGVCTVPGCGAKLSDICHVCHEELAHDGMRATLWMLPDCRKCEAVVAALHHLRRKVNILNLEKLISGEEPNIEALAQLAMANSAAPLVFLDGRFLSPKEIDALLAPEERK